LKKNRFELLSHTADLGLIITAESIEEMLKQASNGLLFLLTDPDSVHPTQRYEFVVVFNSLENLLVRFLNKLIYTFDADGILLCRFDIQIVYGNSEEGGGEGTARVTAFGEAIDHTRHHFKHLVKAATYGGLNITHQNGEYKATVILDD
jgi:SHS2 domain-containing protein